MHKKNEDKYKQFSNQLLDWYDISRRDLPWRAVPGASSNPYFVLLSEIMLQQTVVATVIPYFIKFINKWPTISDLAQADFYDVSTLWAGLGYYRRAKNLHETAKILITQHNGIIPKNKDVLLTFPGIGEYTAAAITAIAFDIKSNVVDGNIERIFSRLYKIEEPLELSKQKIRTLSEKYLPRKRNGDYAQALMDLGSSICIPKTPRCHICPIISKCRLGGDLEAGMYPKRLQKKNKKQRYGVFYLLIDYEGSILFTTNKNDGLFANMDVLPSIGWKKEEQSLNSSPKIITKELSLFNLNWKILENKIDHVFTHFKLNCTLAFHKINKNIPKNLIINKKYRFVKKKNLNQLATPSLIKKILKATEEETIK
ncbi:A/G-specific adenine glycosylase [Alphaproteobacteria bacterium]|nr:A/G-specific adenine glycosylase [Alphaproteobacteria bacterium]